MPLSDLATLFLGERDDNPEVQAKRRRAITRALGGLVSYSVTFKGTPEEIKAKLAEESARLTDQSKQEFDAVRPALDLILDQNQGNGLVLLEANGHATFSDGQRTYSTGSASVKGNQQA